jgi:hypothetical protein
MNIRIPAVIAAGDTLLLNIIGEQRLHYLAYLTKATTHINTTQQCFSVEVQAILTLTIFNRINISAASEPSHNLHLLDASKKAEYPLLPCPRQQGVFRFLVLLLSVCSYKMNAVFYGLFFVLVLHLPFHYPEFAILCPWEKSVCTAFNHFYLDTVQVI